MTEQMKLALDVDKPPAGTAFQPGDLVTGRVELQLPAGLDVPDISLVFQGTAKITLKPGFDAVNQVADTLKQETSRLFVIQNTLAPTRAWKTDAALQTYSAEFSIVFPQYAQCCSPSGSSSSKHCNLPPSSRINPAGLKASFTYTVTARCRRPRAQNRFALNNLLGQRTLSACHVLRFAPPVDTQLQAPDSFVPSVSAPPSAPPSPSNTYVRPNAPLAGSQPVSIQHQSSQQQLAPSFLSASRSPLPSRAASMSSASSAASASVSENSETSTLASRSSISDAPPLYSAPTDGPKIVRSTAYLDTSKLGIVSVQRRQQSACLPAYTPSITLEAVMPNPPIVTPGQPLPLSVFILTPQALLSPSTQLIIKSMDIHLRRTTYARIGSAMRADDASWPLWTYKGGAVVEAERLDAAGLPWDTKKGAPAVAPGFLSCSVSRAYTLEISVAVSTQAAPGKVEYATTAMRVMVCEPPPAYIEE